MHAFDSVNTMLSVIGRLIYFSGSADFISWWDKLEFRYVKLIIQELYVYSNLEAFCSLTIIYQDDEGSSMNDLCSGYSTWPLLVCVFTNYDCKSVIPFSVDELMHHCTDEEEKI